MVFYLADSRYFFESGNGGRRVAFDLHNDDVLADGTLQVGRTALDGDLAAVDDADALSEDVGLFQVLGRKEDRDAEILVDAAYLFPDAVSTERIESCCRLVEEEHFGIVDEGGGEVEAALHATGVRADEAVDGVPDVHERLKLGEPPVDLATRHAEKPSLEAKYLPAGLLGVEGGLLEGGADSQSDLFRLADDVLARDHGAAAVRHQQGN